jgi:hypothetical protein
VAIIHPSNPEMSLIIYQGHSLLLSLHTTAQSQQQSSSCIRDCFQMFGWLLLSALLAASCCINIRLESIPLLCIVPKLSLARPNKQKSTLDQLSSAVYTWAFLNRKLVAAPPCPSHRHLFFNRELLNKLDEWNFWDELESHLCEDRFRRNYYRTLLRFEIDWEMEFLMVLAQ